MRPKAYQSSIGWCCSLCHLPVPVNPALGTPAAQECRCTFKDEFHSPWKHDLSGINHWCYQRYGCSFDSLIVRLRRACRHIERPIDERAYQFRCGEFSTTFRVEHLLHLMRLTVKQRKDVTERLEELKPQLTKKQGAVLMMYLNGKQHREIGKELGISVGASKKVIARVKDKAQSN